MLYVRSRVEANAPRLVIIGCDYFKAGHLKIFDFATQNMPQHNFQLIQAQRFGQQVLILVDIALDPDRDGPVFPWLVTVRIPMRNSNAEGLCDQAELSRSDQVEDQLLSILNDEDYRLLGHVTGNGRREILLYVREPDAVIAKLKGISLKSEKLQGNCSKVTIQIGNITCSSRGEARELPFRANRR